jgi:hypothetical protein
MNKPIKERNELMNFGEALEALKLGLKVKRKP